MLTALQHRGVDLIEGDLFVGFVKQRGLRPAEIIQICVDATSLNDITEVEIRLAMAYEVDFFADQFLHYFVAAGLAGHKHAERSCPPKLAPAYARRRRRAKIGKLLIDESLPIR